MPLTTKQKKHYRAIGHGLNPIVTLAEKGITENLLLELDRALEDHELIKIKLAVADRVSRKQLIQALCEHSQAELVQEIGKVALLFRAAKRPSPRKSNLI